MSKVSIRYSSATNRFDLRSWFIRLWAKKQNKPVVLLNSDPELCGQVLAASNTKGSFIEATFANPAWDPVYSVESVDGELWEQLSRDTRKLMNQLAWRERLPEITTRWTKELARRCEASPTWIVDAEQISRLTLRILYELVFECAISTSDEDLFFQASLEWRKQIGVKGQANRALKESFWKRMTEIIQESRFKTELERYSEDPGRWISVFAQPFILSPQINVSDIMASTFPLLREVPSRLSQAIQWAKEGDEARLNGIILESIRLKHPFPILEREMEKDVQMGEHNWSEGTQVFIILDQFQQDPTFKPERWLGSPSENPYSAIPFGSGKRMCIGKPIATLLLHDMLKNLLTEFPFDQLHPEKNHLYSGRDNDHRTSFSESFYQLKTFSRVLKQAGKNLPFSPN